MEAADLAPKAQSALFEAWLGQLISPDHSGGERVLGSSGLA
eukprot:CAMPEP_0180784182 /NCGR_PEP_ID=MMETSP1038_2-20121128/49456_1 /TAXON_ID=632150 /ORGANISM="Azadinium spinosum, Strain 3D9" /LENGTH=40 /DNA_ID= /DNA_START= /DNA_END= /DNA_ORIENTATION=